MEQEFELVQDEAELLRARRRKRVAELVAQGKSLRKMIDILVDEGIVNPETGNPWALSTIHDDVKALTDEWERDNAKTIQRHRAVMIQQLDYLYGEAVKVGDLRAALQALRDKSALLGTKAPGRTEHEEKVEQTIVVRHEAWKELPEGDDAIEGQVVDA